MSTAHFVKVSELPPSLQQALSSVGYARADVGLTPAPTCSIRCSGGNGYRGFAVLVDLATGRREAHYGSWGGSNAFSPSNAVDLDDTAYAIPDGGAVILGSEGGSRPVLASVYLNPANVAKYLPPADDSVTDRMRGILAIIGGLKSGYRKVELDRMRVTPAELDELVTRGFLSRNKAGATAITTAGKNARGDMRPR